MEVILLESVRKLGIAGSTVKVKDGFGRNYLIPQSKAVRATKENIAVFAEKRAIIEGQNAEKLAAARKLAEDMDNLLVNIVRQGAEDGRLFGSVTAKDIAIAINEKNLGLIERSQIILSKPIKNLAAHDVIVSLHPEVNIIVKVNVIRLDESA